jgi:hypothetical protein
MHATVRRIRVKPQQAAEVARLIESEYLPMINSLDGFVSYTLVDLGSDEVSSVGIFANAESAERANETARSWTTERLGPLVESPLEARAGAVLVAARGAGGT